MSRFVSLRLTVCSLLLLCPLAATAETAPFDSDRWVVEAEEWELEEHLGRPAVRMRGGSAWVGDEDFTDGVIEFDIAFGSKRNFIGASWRLEDSDNFENFYMRPHQSGKADANQYTPFFHGLAGWQLYHGAGHGTAVEYRFNEWQHVKIVFSGSRGEVYVDSTEPILFMHEMKRELQAGKVGLTAGALAPVHFANFTYQKLDNPGLHGQAAELPGPEAGLIESWRVSNVFSATLLKDKITLTDAETSGLEWTELGVESNGLANLARLAGVDRETNTVFARLTLTADKARVVKFRFGYSDALGAFLNGRLLYRGQRLYQSRDFRYLGTIGLFDEMYLQLEEGENELWLAVYEAFGGWGLMATIEDREGLTIE